MSGLVPIPTPETAPFWNAAARRELLIPYCTPCDTHYFYPRPFCPVCGSDQVKWRKVSGRARLTSYIINYLPLPPFDRDVPQVIAVVELDEGPHMMSNIVDVDPDPAQLELEMALEVVFVDRDNITLPMFRPTKETR